MGQEQDGNSKKLQREGGGKQTDRQMGVQEASHVHTHSQHAPPGAHRVGAKFSETWAMGRGTLSHRHTLPGLQNGFYE